MMREYKGFLIPDDKEQSMEEIIENCCRDSCKESRCQEIPCNRCLYNNIKPFTEWFNKAGQQKG